MSGSDSSSLVPGPGASRALTTPALIAALMTAGLGVADAASAAAAGADYTVTSIQITQAQQKNDGSMPLVGGRATFVRATIGATGDSFQDVDGLLRVFVGGQEIPESPYYSDNGPFDAVSGLPSAFEDGTLNFVFLPPEADNVVVQVEVNPGGPNHALETDATNNKKQVTGLAFIHLKSPELAYVPIDYRPTGGEVPNLPDLGLIRPGVGDNFVQGIYPAADVHYHQIAAPSKLWTSSVAASSGGQTLLNSMLVDLNLMTPQPDFFYGWVNGGLSYNGTSKIGGQVSMGNTQNIRHQRTYAHELGHNYGLNHNSITTGLIGVDVENHLNVTEGLPRIKPTTMKDIMYGGQLTKDAWVGATNYTFFLNHPVYDEPADASTPLSDQPALLLAGLWNKDTGEIRMTDSLTIPGAKPTVPAAPADTDLIVTTWSGNQLVQELPIVAKGDVDSCASHDEGGSSDLEDSWEPVAGFSAIVPPSLAGGPVIDRVEIYDPNSTVSMNAPFRMLRSAREPEVELAPPVAGALPGGKVLVSWEGADEDGDELTYYLRYSPNGGERMVPLVTSTTATSFEVDLAKLPALEAGKAFFELMASDGLNTKVVRSEPLDESFALFGSAGSPPEIHICTPDFGFRYFERGTVILHSSGWDLEDLALDGASIEWTSDLDGVIGHGRLTSVVDLSPGVHQITVKATDSDGMETTDSTTILVLARAVPNNPPPPPPTQGGLSGFLLPIR